MRKFGRAEAIQKLSVPELVFGYFNNKYGQRALVDEYVGSLVNTLTLYKKSDLRLEAFARWVGGGAGWGCSRERWCDWMHAGGVCVDLHAQLGVLAAAGHPAPYCRPEPASLARPLAPATSLQPASHPLLRPLSPPPPPAGSCQRSGTCPSSSTS